MEKMVSFRFHNMRLLDKVDTKSPLLSSTAKFLSKGRERASVEGDMNEFHRLPSSPFI